MNNVLQINAIVDNFVTLAKEKWIPKDLKKGRFEGWALGKMKKEYSKLVDKEDKTKEEISKMRALALGIRFKGGDIPGGQRSKGI